MAAPISVEQIQAAEAKLKADMAKYPKLSVAVREGRIKWVVEPGEEVSKLIMVDETDPRYHSQAAFNTPQEAEHFTKGFGNEPTRENGVENFFNRAIRPHYQNTVNDPIRAMQGRGTRDVVQDVLSGARYVTPAVAALMKLPVGPGAVGAGAVNLGLGLASRELTGSDEPWYKETFPNIVGNAAAAGASVAGNKYFSEENTRKRQLKNKVSEKLGISEKEIAKKDPGLYEDIMTPLDAKTAALPEYTYGDWRKRPLTQFDAATGAETMPVTIKRPPMVHADGKSAKIAARKPSTPITDEMATRFLNDLGENRFDANIEDVKKFLKGWTNKLSNEGVTFWPAAGTVRPTKGQWTKMVKEETNPFTKMMLRKQVSFDDPAIQKQWEQALDEFAKRWQKVKGKAKSPIITPKEYSGMGDYSFKLPFLRNGDSPVKLGFRGPIRAAATLLPLAAQASLPYIIKAVGSDDETGPEPLTEDEIATLTTNDDWEPEHPLLPEFVMGMAEDAAEHPVSTVADFIAPVAMLPIALPLRMVESGLRESIDKGGDFGAFKQGAKQELDDAIDAVYTISQLASLPAGWLVDKLDKPINWLKSKMLKSKPKYQPQFDPAVEDTYIATPQVFREDYQW